LHTPDLPAAIGFYAHLCGWRDETVVTASGSYSALDLGSAAVGGGVVQCPGPRAVWLPYVEVPSVGGVTEAAVELGARVLVAPREGPAGWRSVVATPAGGEVALWQPKC
jgi:predicted enzyme related to lactoylglutathione lyase